MSEVRKPYSPRRPPEERRVQILDAALRVLEADGFDGLTIEAAAREADLAKTVIYDVIGNRHALLEALIAREQGRAIADVAAALPTPPFTSPEDVIAEGMRRLLDAVREHPATWRLILIPAEGAPTKLRAAVDEHRARLRDQLLPVVTWGLAEARVDDLDPAIAVHVLLASVESAIRLVITEQDDITPERLAEFGRAIVRRLA